MAGLGPTHYRWRFDVQLVVDKIHRRFPNVLCNTYVDHPWEGWDHLSIDVWGVGGRGWRIRKETGYEVRRFVMKLPGKPLIRHTIYEHALWTRWGGYSFWAPDDHSDEWRHFHVTYLP